MRQGSRASRGCSRQARIIPPYTDPRLIGRPRALTRVREVYGGTLASPGTQARIKSRRVELAALQARIENAEIRRGIRPVPQPLPTAVIYWPIPIQQMPHEPSSPDAIDQQCLARKEAVIWRAIVQPTSLSQLAHTGIHQRIAGQTGLPGLQIANESRQGLHAS